MFAALVTAACVAVGAIVIALLHPPQHASRTPVAGTQRTAVTGRGIDPGFGGYPLWWNSRWILTDVRGLNGTVQIPRSLSASMSFGPVNQCVADDSLNTTTASCAVSAQGRLTFGTATSTAVGYAGHDRALIAAITGLDAVMNSGATGCVVSRMSNGRLVVRVAHYWLTFSERGQPAPLATTPAPPSSTGTAPAHPSQSYINGSELAPS